MCAQIKIGFKGLNVSNKLVKGSAIVAAMTGNPNFPTPNPTIDVVKASLGIVANALKDAFDGGKTKTAIVRLRVKDLELHITLLAGYVQMVSRGDEEIILSAGFEVRKRSTPKPLPDQPTNVKITATATEGQVIVSFKKVINKVGYIIEKSADGLTNWLSCGTETKTKKIVDDLLPATYVWFRVTAFNATGDGPPSAAVKVLVG